MLDLAPAFVHFSGHGASSGSICVEDEAGNSIELEPEAIAALFEASGFALGGVFGMIGTVVTQRNLQAASWGIDGVGLVVATPCRFLHRAQHSKPASADHEQHRERKSA